MLDIAPWIVLSDDLKKITIFVQLNYIFGPVIVELESSAVKWIWSGQIILNLPCIAGGCLASFELYYSNRYYIQYLKIILTMSPSFSPFPAQFSSNFSESRSDPREVYAVKFKCS